MNNKSMILFFLSFFLISCSSNNGEIVLDSQCVQRAQELVPAQVVLSFQKAFNGYDDQELYYVLDSITWSNGHKNQIDRAFRKPTIAGLNKNYYYPIDKDTKLDSSWTHSEEITYLNNNPYYAKYTYNLILDSTEIISMGQKVNQLSGFPEKDTSKGTRVFNILESRVILCDDDA